MAGLKRTARIIVCLWLVSGIAASPFAYFTRVNYYPHPFTGELLEESAVCAISHPPPAFLFEASAITFFLLPLLALIFLYVRMGLKIHEAQQMNLGKSVKGDQKETSGNRKSVFQMLAAVVVSFFVCWAPFHTQRLLHVFIYSYNWSIEIDLAPLFYVTGVLLYLSSTINPVLYNLMSAKYRRAFRSTCNSLLCHKRNPLAGNQSQMFTTRFNSPTLGLTSSKSKMVGMSSKSCSPNVRLRVEFKGPVEDESAEESCQQSTPLLLGKGVQNGESCREKCSFCRGGDTGTAGIRFQGETSTIHLSLLNVQAFQIVDRRLVTGNTCPGSANKIISCV